MAGWHHDGVFKEKECVVCSKPFTPKSGVHKFCSEKCKGRWKYIVGTTTTESQYKIISGNWRKYFNRLRNQKERQNLTVDALMELYHDQKGKCALSGEELTCVLERGKINKTNASIDRIDAGGEYKLGNIQLVCRALNSWRGDTPLNEFINWCVKVADKAKKDTEEISYAK